MSCTRTTRRAYTSYECNANTSRARRHRERRGTGPHHTMIEAHTACLPQLRRGGTLRKQQRWFEQAARSSFEFFFLKKATRCELTQLMARISRDARIARNRPQEATCIDKYVRTLIFSMHVRDATRRWADRHDACAQHEHFGSGGPASGHNPSTSWHTHTPRYTTTSPHDGHTRTHNTRS